MAEYSNTAEGGTHAATITPANSGGASGSAFGFVTGAVTYDNTRAAHGSLSAKVAPVSGSPAYVQLGAVGSGWAAMLFAFRFYVYFAALPTTTYTLFRANDDNSSTMGVRYNIDNAGKLILGYGNGSTVTAWTSTQAVPTNQWVRVEGRIAKSATAGQVAGAFYAGDSGTAIDSFTSATNLNTGTAAMTAAALGKYGTDTSAAAFWFDDFKVDTNRGSFIGPVSNAAPIASAGADITVLKGQPFQLDGSATDPDGTVASVLWQQTGGTVTGLSDATALKPFGVAPNTAGDLTYTLTAVDNGGQSSAPDAVVVHVVNVGNVVVGYNRRVFDGTNWV